MKEGGGGRPGRGDRSLGDDDGARKDVPQRREGIPAVAHDPVDQRRQQHRAGDDDHDAQHNADEIADAREDLEIHPAAPGLAARIDFRHGIHLIKNIDSLR